MITGRQIRAARALIDMSQDELAQAAGLTPQGLRKIESGDVQPREGTMADIVRVFNERGLEFTDNNGVKFSPKDIQVLEGSDGFLKFYEIVFSYISQHGGDICVSGVDERLFSKYRPNAERHRDQMSALTAKRKDIIMRILIQEGDYNFSASNYATYRWQKRQYFSPTSFYVFGDMLALISFSHEPPPQVILIKSSSFAQAYRHSFNLAWNFADDPPSKKGAL